MFQLTWHSLALIVGKSLTGWVHLHPTASALFFLSFTPPLLHFLTPPGRVYLLLSVLFHRENNPRLYSVVLSWCFQLFRPPAPSDCSTILPHSSPPRSFLDSERKAISSGVVYLLLIPVGFLLTIFFTISVSSKLPSQYLPSEYLPSLSFSTSKSNPDDTISYRMHLQHTTSPYLSAYTPTLSRSPIFMYFPSSRRDRRDQLLKLADALGLRITFVDAESKEASFNKWIAERVYEVRQQKVALMKMASSSTALSCS